MSNTDQAVNQTSFQIDYTKKLSAEENSSIVFGVAFCIFAFTFMVFVTLLLVLYPINLTAIIVSSLFIIGGIVFSVIGIKSLSKNLSRRRITSNILKNGQFAFAYITDSKITKSSRGNMSSNTQRHFTNVAIEYSYCNNGEKVFATFHQIYSTSETVPQFNLGRKIGIMYLENQSRILNQYSLVDMDNSANRDMPIMRSFKGLSKKTINFDTTKWYYTTSTLSRFYFIMSLAIMGMLGLPTTGLSIYFVLGLQDTITNIVAIFLNIPMLIGLILFISSLVKRHYEKSFFKRAKFTKAKVYPMQEAYQGNEKTYVTYCYIDSNGTKHQKYLKQNTFVKLIKSISFAYVAYIGDKSILILPNNFV